MSAAPLLQINPQFTLAIAAGPDRGKKYRLTPPRVRIGRELDNHIVIEDLKVSRYHLELQWSGGNCFIVDVAQKQNIILNGSAINSANTILQSGDEIEIGNSVLRFEILQSAPPVQISSVQKSQPMQIPSSPISQNLSNMSLASNGRSQRSESSPFLDNSAPVKPKKSPLFYFLILGVVRLFVLMLTSKTKEKKKDDGIRNTEQIQQSILDSQKVQQHLEERREKMTVPKQIAQNLYAKGFRDYQKGNYLRAATSFQAALASDPNHELSLRYYSLSQRRNDEMIDSSLQMAQRYKGKAMFNRCISDAQKVMTLLTNPRHPKYEEAMQLKKECQLLDEAGNF